VGLVHIGVAGERGPREKAFRFPGDRDRIRQYATQTALDMVRRHFPYSAHARG
jgi:nicotinamide mononucleotide (NMN) deamidase PncC